MTYYNLESRTIIWNFRTKKFNRRPIIQPSYDGTSCTQYVQYANMHMDCRTYQIIVEYVKSQFSGVEIKKIEDLELWFLTNSVPD